MSFPENFFLDAAKITARQVSTGKENAKKKMATEGHFLPERLHGRQWRVFREKSQQKNEKGGKPGISGHLYEKLGDRRFPTRFRRNEKILVGIVRDFDAKNLREFSEKEIVQNRQK